MTEGKRRIPVIIIFLIRAIVYSAFIFFVSPYIKYGDYSFALGLNPVTFLTTGLLGFAGLLGLFGLKIYFTLL